MKAEVSIVSCRNYQRNQVQEAVKKAIELIGGISKFVRPGSRVLVKPNLLMAVAPEAGIDTHPEVVRAVVKILKEINCRVILGDAPSVWAGHSENTERVYELSGVKKICEEEGVRLVKFERKIWRDGIPLTSRLDECDFLVSIPKFKTHDLTILTGAIKNLFGLVPGTFKTELHKNHFKPEDFSKILVDIYQRARPALTLVDAITAMEGEGPATSGKLRQTNLLLASGDCVALDSVMAMIMGIEPGRIFTTREASKRGLGVSDKNSISIKGESLKNIISQPFELPPTGSFKKKIPEPLVNIIKKLIKYYPVINHKKCTRCRVCIEVCPVKAMNMKNERITVNYSKCIACFCCQENCPAAAINIKKSIFAKIIGL
ncbi:MAG: hypothetical protein DRP74_02450 [Candidatus Omnitrophota bacterium]|mgnify:CR=1 FL=1|nr:MAG: hypothetical protein DRP74_02450 [Candidatus Omnitrophota bacterium]